MSLSLATLLLSSGLLSVGGGAWAAPSHTHTEQPGSGDDSRLGGVFLDDCIIPTSVGTFCVKNIRDILKCVVSS